MYFPYFVLLTFLVSAVTVVPCVADEGKERSITEIAQLNLEELMQERVTSVLRKEHTLSKSPAAIGVLTAEEIRRSGATSIAEALRLIPGITVARQNAHSWVVTARGFDVKGGTKLLVLIDGRSVYSPFFSGVFWDIQDTVLEDIDRIEVIRGPGAVTWGENAVNGVINIITKSSAETQGLLAVAGAGKQEDGFGTLRYGGSLGGDTTYRAYGKYFDRGENHLAGGGESDDGWDMSRGGFRVDSTPTEAKKITFQGDLYSEESADQEKQLQSFVPPFTSQVRNETISKGGNLLFRYSENLSKTSQISVQTYYDYVNRYDLVSGEKRDTVDFDLQHHITLFDVHDVVYGGNYRHTKDYMGESFSAHWNPTSRSDDLLTAFVQDEISIVSDTFSVIPGIKLGHNDYSGFEYQPAIKAVYTPTEVATVWGSISRAVRIPSRFDEDLRFYAGAAGAPDGTILVPSLVGSRSVDAENLVAYELGYRAAPLKTVSYDLATFYHHYSDLLSFEPGTPYAENEPAPPHIIIPLIADNKIDGSAYGAELAVTWRPNDTMTIAATYSYCKVEYNPDKDSHDTISSNVPRRTPRNQASLRGRVNLPYNLEFDTILYYVDSIPSFNVDSYVRTDVRLGWNATEHLSLDAVGQNVFDSGQVEYGGVFPVDLERAYFGRATYHF